MPHAFDTGLLKPQRTLIRDSIVAMLSGLLRANGGYLAAVIPWGGVVRGYTDEVGIDAIKRALQGKAPAIAVAVGDRVSSPAGMGGKSHQSELELVLYHYSNHPASLTEGRVAATAAALATTTLDPGLDVMLEHAHELVIGQFPGGTLVTNPVGEKSRRTATVKNIVPTREEELATDNASTLWSQRFTIAVDLKITTYRGVTQLLEEIRTIVRPSDVAADVDPNPAAPGERVLELENTTTP